MSSPHGSRTALQQHALRFVVLIGVLSFFADFAYEGSRGIVGPYLAVLGASALTISVVSGAGEFLGYGLRLFSGRAADSTQKFWPIAIFGYLVQMAAVPALALCRNWQAAAVLLVLERVGKAIRNPPRDVMLSHAGKQIGHGWAFGLHEALDQFGALCGPLLMALILAWRHAYRLAFAALAIPASMCLLVVFAARLLYPAPERMDAEPLNMQSKGLPRVFWQYLAAAGLIAAGFADYPLLAFHLQNRTKLAGDAVPVFYAIAMGVSGLGSLVAGKLYDRFGFPVLIVMTVVTAGFAPLIFFGSFWPALAGTALWGLGMGVHESLIPAAVAPMVPLHRRASAYGLFTAVYGLFWLLGSVAIGLLYGSSLPGATAFCVLLELAALPMLIAVARQRPEPAR